jgi:outer membrane protein OmpA-like peptidoglycan-associated protein
MDSVMNKFQKLPLALMVAVIVSGCSSVPYNANLAEAHNSFNDARFNSEISTQAPLELKQASDTLNKADVALKEDEDKEAVDHLAYLAKQQVAIAQVTAQRKTAETVVNKADASRSSVQLDARTAEADAAKLLIEQQNILINELNAQKTERGLVITLSDVLFRTDKAQLQSEGLRNVDKLADFLHQYPGYKVLVEGYTDSRGSDQHNQDLSNRRADSVSRELLHSGISRERVITRGYGEEYPVADNDTASSRQLNRRVEIILSDANGNIASR